MNADGAIFLFIFSLFVMNVLLIIVFQRVQASFLKRRDGTLAALRGMGGPYERTLSWADESGLALVIGSMLMFDLFFLMFALTLVDGDIPDYIYGSLLISIIFGFLISISLGTIYARIDLRHIYMVDQNGIQGFVARRNGPLKGTYLEWRGISRVKFMRTYRVPSAIGIRLTRGSDEIVLLNYLKNYPMILSHLINFGSAEIRSTILSEYGQFIDGAGNISFPDD